LAERASGARFWWLGALSNRKRAGCKKAGLSFKNIDGIVDLFKQVLCVKIPISVFPCFEEHPSLAKLKEVSLTLL
jgi:hypothetical protein